MRAAKPESNLCEAACLGFRRLNTDERSLAVDQPLTSVRNCGPLDWDLGKPMGIEKQPDPIGD